MTYEQKFNALDSLPPDPVVRADWNFVMYRQVGQLLILSGYGPFWGSDVAPDCKGKIGEKLTVEQGAKAARLTAINLLLITKQCIQTLDNVVQVVSVEGMVNAAPTFTRHPDVMNGCSALLVDIFGDNGRHTRSAVGVNSLGYDICVEISMSLLVR